MNVDDRFKRANLMLKIFWWLSVGCFIWGIAWATYFGVTSQWTRMWWMLGAIVFEIASYAGTGIWLKWYVARTNKKIENGLL